MLYLFTFLLTPWSTDLLEKLIGFQLVKIFPALYGTWRFITAFASARHLSLSWASSIQSIFHYLKCHLNIILPSTPWSPKWTLFLRYPHQNPVYDSPLPHTRYMPRPSHSCPRVAGGPPFVGCPQVLIKYICSYPPCWRQFLHPHPKDAPF
jgi:hypothetical protein